MVAVEASLGSGCSAEKGVIGKGRCGGGSGWVSEGELVLQEGSPVSRQEEGGASADGFGERFGFLEGGQDKAVIKEESQS